MSHKVTGRHETETENEEATWGRERDLDALIYVCDARTEVEGRSRIGSIGTLQGWVQYKFFLGFHNRQVSSKNYLNFQYIKFGRRGSKHFADVISVLRPLTSHNVSHTPRKTPPST